MKRLRSYVANVLNGTVFAAWNAASALLGTRVRWRIYARSDGTETAWAMSAHSVDHSRMTVTGSPTTQVENPARRRSRSTNARQREWLWKDQGRSCFWCGCECVLSFPAIGERHAKDMFTVDHIVTVRRGGSSSLDNLVGACSACNQMRGCIEQAILLGKDVSGFGKRMDIEHLFPVMSVEEVLIELKDRLEPRYGPCPPKPELVRNGETQQ